METKENNLVKWDFVEANPSEEARKDFYNGIKHLEEGNYFEAGIDFSNYKTDNFEFDAKVPSYFHKQVVEGHIGNAIKHLKENDFYNVGSDLGMAEDYLKRDAEELKRKEIYLENVEKLKKTLVNKVFNNIENSISKDELFDAESSLDFLESYFDFEGKSLKENYFNKFKEYRTKIENKDFDYYIGNELEHIKQGAEWELKWNKFGEEEKEFDFYINNFDKFYELANFEDESPVIGLKPIKNLDRQTNQKEGEYLVNHKGNNKVAFGKESLEGRLN